jgi:hypothetical protein
MLTLPWGMRKTGGDMDYEHLIYEKAGPRDEEVS